MLGRRTIIFGPALASSIAGTTGALSSACKPTSRESLSRRLLGGLTENSVVISDRGGPSGRSSGTQDRPLFLKPVFLGSVPSLRSGPGMTAIWPAFQQPALAVSAAPSMSNAAAKAATAGVSEACAMREAAADIMGEAAAHPMSEPVVEIARRARIVRSVAPVIG